MLAHFESVYLHRKTRNTLGRRCESGDMPKSELLAMKSECSAQAQCIVSASQLQPKSYNNSWSALKVATSNEEHPKARAEEKVPECRNGTSRGSKNDHSLATLTLT